LTPIVALMMLSGDQSAPTRWSEAPRPSRAAPGVVWWIEDEDAEPTAGQGRSGAGHQWAIQRVGVVGDEYDGWAMVLVARVVNEEQFWRGSARTEHRLGCLQQRAHLCIAVVGALYRIAVDS
jgi:hypothetical protein